MASMTAGMRPIEYDNLTEAINNAIDSHPTDSTDCTRPRFKVAEERVYGVAFQVKLQCQTCGYITPAKKVYTEVESRVPNPTAVNLGLAVGSQDTPIASAKARYLGASITRDRMGLVGIGSDPVPGFSIWHFWIPGPGF